MDRLRFADLADATGGELRSANPSAEFTKNSIDSRSLVPGDVFWALAGEHTDGHEHAAAAFERGAGLIVCRADRAESISGPRLVVADPLKSLQTFAAWYRQQQDALVIGVTGSVGKTTTRGLIDAVLSGQFCGVQSPASFNNHLGVPLSLLNVEQQHEYAVLEMGASHGGEIRRLCEIAQPEVGVITAIGRAHLEGFGGIDGVIRGKGELLESLPKTGFCVLPGDDPIIRRMALRAQCRTMFVGENSENDLVANRMHVSENALSFQVDGQELVVTLAGRHHLTNALIAVAIGREIGMEWPAIQAGLARFRPAPGRCQPLRIGPWQVIDDTYNANLTSMSAALELLKQTNLTHPQRCFAVLGDMLELGPMAKAEHFALGTKAGQMRVDGLLACGEFAHDVAQGAYSAGIPAGRLVATPQLQILLTMLDCWLEPGDVILVKGSRGMRMERVIDWLRTRAESLNHDPPSRCA